MNVSEAMSNDVYVCSPGVTLETAAEARSHLGPGAGSAGEGGRRVVRGRAGALIGASP
jgi:hypothetical protein